MRFCEAKRVLSVVFLFSCLRVLIKRCSIEGDEWAGSFMYTKEDAYRAGHGEYKYTTPQINSYLVRVASSGHCNIVVICIPFDIDVSALRRPWIVVNSDMLESMSHCSEHVVHCFKPLTRASLRNADLGLFVPL